MIGFTDVTDLVQEREFTNSLMSSSSALIITQTRDGVIHSVSQAFVDLMGYAREDIIGKDLIISITQRIRRLGRRLALNSKMHFRKN